MSQSSRGGPPVLLTASDAVAALILLEDGRHLLQHRDDVPGIWFPGYWGCFGGSVSDGEKPFDALRRELYEELELKVREADYFVRLDFDLTNLGLVRCYRIYYVVRLSSAEHDRLVLHEGRAVAAFAGEAALRDLRITPYDAFAIYLYHARDTLAGSGMKE
jgi:8-oxo-dGTP pyrophosphatase MutT (NUDIX family)